MQPRTTLFFAALTTPFLFIAGCGGGGGGGGNGAQPSVSFSMTDAASDEVVAFNCDVTAITLIKQNGAHVDLLTDRVRIDFASLRELSQIINTTKLHTGAYTAATITLDFSTANCFLTGQTSPAGIIDIDGNPLTGLMTLPIDLRGEVLHAKTDHHYLMELDFDLNQSLIVDTTANQVAVEPAFLFSTNPSSPKTLYAMAQLVDVSVSKSQFTVTMEALGGAPLSDMICETGTGTSFQVDGTHDTGTDGLKKLANLPAGTWVQVYGQLNKGVPRLVAKDVEAGLGTFNGGNDLIEGEITDRTGAAGADATFTVMGSSQNAAHTVVQLEQSFTVNTTFANTKVLRRFSGSAFNTDDLNVGQRVIVFGSLSGTTMDATGGIIRQIKTDAFGHANGDVQSDTLDMKLERVDMRDQSVFTWADSGSTPVDPDHCKIDVSVIGTLPPLTTGTPVRSRGFFKPVNDSSQDFGAQELQNLTLENALLSIRDRTGGMTVATTALSASIEFAITGTPITGEQAVLDQGFIGSQTLGLLPPPTVVPKNKTGHYSLRDKTLGSIVIFDNFKDFSDELAQQISLGAFIDQFTAVGPFDKSSNKLSCEEAAAVIH
jgi:hypothetical protein